MSKHNAPANVLYFHPNSVLRPAEGLRVVSSSQPDLSVPLLKHICQLSNLPYGAQALH